MTAESEGKPTPAIEYIHGPGICACSYRLLDLDGPDVRVRIIDIAQVKTGWMAQGKIRLVATRCPFCSGVYEQLRRYVPIECATFPCPSCGPGSKLTADVMSITEIRAGYSFIALLKCEACSKQSRPDLGQDSAIAAEADL